MQDVLGEVEEMVAGKKKVMGEVQEVKKLLKNRVKLYPHYVWPSFRAK